MDVIDLPMSTEPARMPSTTSSSSPSVAFANTSTLTSPLVFLLTRSAKCWMICPWG
jgi:hypothetical protein